MASWASRRAAGDRIRIRFEKDGGALAGPINSRNLVADTTGTSIPNGLINSVISTTLPSNWSVSSPAVGAFQDITGLNISLNPGTYTICTQLTYTQLALATASSAVALNASIQSGTNTYETGVIVGVAGIAGSFPNNYTGCLS